MHMVRTDKQNDERGLLTPEDTVLYDAIQSEGLHHKFDGQLADIHTVHSSKRSRVAEEEYLLSRYPGSHIVASLAGAMGMDMTRDEAISELEARAEKQYNSLVRKKSRIDAIVDTLVPAEQRLRRDSLVSRDPIGTTYYADADAGSDANAGTSTGAAWATFHKFTETSRSPGDKLICRGGMDDGYDDGGPLVHTSDGHEVDGPLTVTMDYGDAFGDHVDITDTQSITVTAIWGSNTLTASADISSHLAANDFIYLSGDDNTVHSYLVRTVVTTTITLWRLYTGNDDGSGKTIVNMLSPPKWTPGGVDTNDINISSDLYWHYRGIHSSHTNPPYACWDVANTTWGLLLHDCISDGSGGDSVRGIQYDLTQGPIVIRKCVWIDLRYAIITQYAGGVDHHHFYDNVFVQDSQQGTTPFYLYGNNGTAFINRNKIEGTWSYFTRFGHGITIVGRENDSNDDREELSGLRTCTMSWEDHNDTRENTKIWHQNNNENDLATQESDTGTTFADGPSWAWKIIPDDSTGKGGTELWAPIQIYEYDVYLEAQEYTVTCDVLSNTTANWTADPTAAELFLEVACWGHATVGLRREYRSTEVADFNGSTAEQTLSVTCTPSVAGYAKVRLVYLKAREPGMANVFRANPKIRIT